MLWSSTIMADRGSREWIKEIATTGQWWEPPFWEHPDYVAHSPWSAERLGAAFTELKKLYTEKEARAAFTGEHPLQRLLACQLRPDLSGLVRLGLDAVDADVFGHGELVRRLRTDNGREFKGARFELRSLAALRNAGIVADYEPLAGKRGSNPDFLLRLPGLLYVDAKHSEEGDWVKEEHQWFCRLSMHPDPAGLAISAHVRLTDRFQSLQDTDNGRTFIRSQIDYLAEELERTKVRLATSGGPFPAVDCVGGLIEVEVLGPPGSSSSGSSQGVPTDIRREVARVVRGAVAKGATQIPDGEIGVVLLNPGMHASSHILVEEVERWMAAEGEGADYPKLVGVLVVAELLREPVPGVLGRVETIVPVWRTSTPAWVENGPWKALSNAFAKQDMEALAKRCAHADPGVE